ncbi:plasma membrane H+-ATPase [Sporothrix stenoceras]|uniref:Plasma membrane H+-ATPase n=1 Tax=Sporothrix stenoceras TaxID=5173 RepID=A0ABR3Z1V1_9PEZI
MPAPFVFPGHYWDEAKGKFFKIEATTTAPEGAAWSQDHVAFQQSQQRNAEEHRRRQERSEEVWSSHGRSAKRRNRRGRHRPDGQPVDAIYSFLAQHPTGIDDDAAYVVKSKRFLTQYPILAHEMASAGLPGSATVGVGRIPGLPHAAIAASTYGCELEFKGAVPVIDEDFTMMLDSQMFNPNRRDQWAAMGTVPGRRMARPFTIGRGRPSILSHTKITAMYVHGEEQPPGMGIIYTNYSMGVLDTIKGQYAMVDEDE